ncbi:MAG TPA: PH domain-containing protein [Thermoleophilaceae bacterium]|nr:PH domain-containing protein [Thermoleophilaceae bacterium]
MLGALAWAVPVGIGCVVAGSALAGSEAPGVLAWLAWALALLVVALGGLVVPLLRWRSWRYEVRDEEIDLLRGAVVVRRPLRVHLLRGAVVVRRTLIPMARVQHVDTQRTPLSDLFELRSVTVHTAAGSHSVPALRPADAASMRDRIALLAREPDAV